MLSRLKSDEIGGGVVRFGMRIGERYLRAGTRLTAEEVKGLRYANRQAMIDRGMLSVWPKSNEMVGTTDAGIETVPAVQPATAVNIPIAGSKLHVVHTGRGHFDVIDGIKLNDAPLTKDGAYDLAGVPKDN